MMEIIDHGKKAEEFAENCCPLDVWAVMVPE